ncbi:MAG: ABC transporter permease [Planctomycetes bacterium]|nr:ABC transporter permease [Planctomycetota bacterium]
MTTLSTMDAFDEQDLTVARTPTQEAWRRFKKDKLGLVFLVVIAIYFLVALWAGTFGWGGSYEVAGQTRPAYEASMGQLGIQLDGKPFPESQVPPTLAGGANTILGTDALGRSVFYRGLQSTKVAFIVGTFGALLSVVIGMTLGLLAGFLGGWVDRVVVFVYSTLASIPYLLLMLAIAFVVKKGDFADWYDDLKFRDFDVSDFISLGLLNLVVVIGLTSWVTLCRLVRAEVFKVRELDYVNAARSLGFGTGRILFRHVLPNVFHLVIINFSLTFVIAIKSEVILTFLGVGVDKEPSWGQTIAGAKNELMTGIWWPLATAGTLLFGLTLAVNYVGDALRDALDPKLKT